MFQVGMPAEIPDAKTQVTLGTLIPSIWLAWDKFFGAPPAHKESVWLLVAQIQLETGLKYCHNWNLGNVKSVEGDGHDYQFYACNEILPVATAQKYAQQSPDTAKVTSVRSDGKAIIWFYPKHPGCRFRAFKTLDDGAFDHLKLLARRFDKAWPEIIEGDVVGYSQKLRQQGYYTADEASYTNTLKGCMKIAAKAPVDYASLPFLGEHEKERLKGLVANSIQNLLFENEHPSMWPEVDEDDKPIA
jgi:hypothetical protein